MKFKQTKKDRLNGAWVKQWLLNWRYFLIISTSFFSLFSLYSSFIIFFFILNLFLVSLLSWPLDWIRLDLYWMRYIGIYLLRPILLLVIRLIGFMCLSVSVLSWSLFVWMERALFYQKRETKKTHLKRKNR